MLNIITVIVFRIGFYKTIVITIIFNEKLGQSSYLSNIIKCEYHESIVLYIMYDTRLKRRSVLVASSTNAVNDKKSVGWIGLLAFQMRTGSI